ncbi:MAG: MFS transporter [Blastochloris sp.]|nr:MFS transporter [Blastochloris sp.]
MPRRELLALRYSYRLAQIPDHLQGRVNSVFRLILFGSQAFGIALTGLLLQAVRPVTTVLLTFIPQLALAIAITCNRAFHLVGTDDDRVTR